MSGFKHKHKYHRVLRNDVYRRETSSTLNYIYVKLVLVFFFILPASRHDVFAVLMEKTGEQKTNSILAEAQSHPWANSELPFQMRSLTSLWILMMFIDVFNKFFPFCWLLMGSVILDSAAGAMEQTSGRYRETDGQRMRQRQRERKWKRYQEFSHSNPFGQELWVNYSSFVFYLATSVWEWGSSKPCQALIDAVWLEGFAQCWRQDRRCAGSEGVIVSGIGVGTNTDGSWLSKITWGEVIS